MPRYAIGFDFGTESVRVLIADVHDGRVMACSASAYEHGVLDQSLPIPGAGQLPADYALQHPLDWMNSAAQACRDALAQSGIGSIDVVGIGVDFTSCTMLPAKADGTPLCLLDDSPRFPLAWPKLWKHHGAKAETDRINQVARERNEPWLARYGGTIGLEWFFPKVLETLVAEPAVYAAADVWLEAGDWFVWQLISGPFPAMLDRCRSFAPPARPATRRCGTPTTGYPSARLLRRRASGAGDVVRSKMPGTLARPGRAGGLLSEAAAELLGLRRGRRYRPRSSTPTPACPARASPATRHWCWSWAPVPAT